MKTLLSVVCLLGLLATALRATEASLVDQLRAADDERVAAMGAADHARLDRIFSDELRYAHSTGAVDTKATLMRTLESGASKYLGIDYEVRDFKLASPGVALMTGRAIFRLEVKGRPLSLHLGFLAVWRNESGQWRFLAWQSCPVPPTPTATSGK